MRSQKYNRIITAIVAATAASIVLAGCSGSPSGVGSAGGSTEITIGATSPTGSYEVQALQRWADAVADRTDGAVEIRILADGQLGNELETIESIETGDIEGIGGGLIGLEEWDFLAAPYIARDREHMRAIVRSDQAEEWKQDWKDSTGIEMVGLLERLPRTLTANTKITSADDVNGLNIRVPALDFHIAAWEALGAVPTAIPPQEVYSALESGIVDAQENTLDTTYAWGVGEVQDYVMLTEHNMLPQVVGIRADVLDALSEDNRAVLEDEMVAAEEWLSGELDGLQEEILSDLESQGVTVIKPDIDSFADKMQPVTAKFAERIWGAGVFDELQTLK